MQEQPAHLLIVHPVTVVKFGTTNEFGVSQTFSEQRNNVSWEKDKKITFVTDRNVLNLYYHPHNNGKYGHRGLDGLW